MVLSWVTMVLLGVPGRKFPPCQGGWRGRLGHRPSQQDCYPLPYLERASNQEPRVHGTIRPHQAGAGRQGSRLELPGSEVQVEACV